jgi:hypothetical protein
MMIISIVMIFGLSLYIVEGTFIVGIIIIIIIIIMIFLEAAAPADGYFCFMVGALNELAKLCRDYAYTYYSQVNGK